MPIIYGAVGAPSNVSAADGANNPLLQGKQGELIASELHGKYYTQNYRNNVYYAANAAAGNTVSVFSATSFTGLGLWNLAGSGKNLVLIRATLALSTAAGTATTFGYVYQQNVGSAVGTAAPITATTPITATRGPAVLGPLTAGQGNSVAIAVSAATLTTAPTLFIPTGLGSGTGAITVPSTTLGVNEYFDGSLIIAPGTFFGFAVAVSSTNTSNASFLWEEVPL
jgi:hypothetical protein